MGWVGGWSAGVGVVRGWVGARVVCQASWWGRPVGWRQQWCTHERCGQAWCGRPRTGRGPIEYLLLCAGKAALHPSAPPPMPLAVRTPGGRHHAHKSKAAGFCYTNDVVLAILALLGTFRCAGVSGRANSSVRCLHHHHLSSPASSLSREAAVSCMWTLAGKHATQEPRTTTTAPTATPPMQAGAVHACGSALHSRSLSPLLLLAVRVEP